MGDAPTEALIPGGVKTTKILPVDNTTTPYWRTQLHPLDEHRSTEELPSECDIAIIGAGMSGVSTAYHLAIAMGSEKLRSIILLEARQLCSGATGRNGGHVKIKTDTFFKLIQHHGLDAAMEIRDLVMNQIYAIKHAAETENIDCEFELRRSYDVFIDDNVAEQVQQDFQTSFQAGQRWTREVDFVGDKYAEQLTSIKGAKAALSGPACSLWPYKFVSQLLARLVEARSVNLQTNTPVTRITKSNGLNILHTPRGTVKAKKLVFATNAYTAGISPEYANKIIPYRGTAVHITPSSPISPHLSHTYNIHYQLPEATEPVDYLNPRPDGSIVVGGGKWTYASDLSKWYNNWDDSTLLEEARPHFDGLMQRHFKGWEKSEAKTDMMWTGIMGSTPDGLPHIGEVLGSEGSQYILAGFNGGGNALIFLCAKGLARMMLEGIPYEETGLPRLFKTSRERLE